MTRSYRSSFLAVMFVAVVAQVVSITVAAPPASPVPVVADMKNPESVCVAEGEKQAYTLYVTEIGEFDKDGDGTVLSVLPGKKEVFCAGLDDPKGIVLHNGTLFVTDKQRIWRIPTAGKGPHQAEVFVTAEAFPRPPVFLNDIAADEAGNLFVSDSGARDGSGGGGLFRITPAGQVTTILDSATRPELKRPNGVLIEDAEHLLLVDFGSGNLYRVTIADGTLIKLADGFDGGDGLARDVDGNLYISSWKSGSVWVMRNVTSGPTLGSANAPHPGGYAVPQLISKAFDSAADICVRDKSGHIVVPDMRAGKLATLPIVSNNPSEIDETPLEVAIAPAWPNLEINRPLILTHAGDGSGRRFVASQLGRVYILPTNEEADEARLFFDLTPRVTYKDSENEEGFLGLAFHPKFKSNGQFFVYYVSVDEPHLAKISRFTVHSDNPNLAEASTEEELLRIPQPYWNHKGGTICFGPDGYLYVGLGDGGAANDPHGNGQNLKTLLGSILRIDVDQKDPGKAYAVPKDNPFVGRSDAEPEIYAYGVRNIWRLSFDRQTGQCWAADVGQDIWEEINLIRSGGNYGWNLREGRHRFTRAGSAPRSDLVEPIWEYHHDLGKSITGGHVYRGKAVPALAGLYLYADYVTGQLWGLKYDESAKRVVANRPIAGNISPVMSFGEDEAAEVYFLTVQGRIFRFQAKN